MLVPIANGDKFDLGAYDDCCPVHGACVKAEYDFGRGDCHVLTFGCGCAAYANTWNEQFYYESYSLAVGRARLTVASNKVW
jgi:hypothetical protein